MCLFAQPVSEDIGSAGVLVAIVVLSGMIASRAVTHSPVAVFKKNAPLLR